MRTSLIIGTLCVLGAGATGVGATFATQPFNGYDTLFNVTNRAMPAAGLGNNGDYVGGGSGAGENNMTSNPPKQWMAPMSDDQRAKFQEIWDETKTYLAQ